MSAPLAATAQPASRGTLTLNASATVTNPAPGNTMGLDSASLLNGQKAVTIVHNGTPYRLQATKLGKLILTK